MFLILFWSAAILIIYAYFVFPFLVFLRGLLFSKPHERAEITPKVSLIIAAYNEEKSIGSRIENALSLDFPSDRLEVIIASDGSTDRTNAIVSNYEDRGVKLIELPRQGKFAALNAAVKLASGEILVFSDANSEYARDSLRALVRPFADPQVGGVAGDQLYLIPESVGSSGEGERSYWNYDRMLKKFQSRSGNVISATGAIYAIRRELFQPIPPGAVDDFVTSTRVILQGYRLVFAEDATAFEPVAKSSQAEFGRKVRVINQGLHAVWTMRALLNPFRFGFYSLQLFSHKVLRRLIFLPLILVLLVNPFLWQHGLFYQLMMIAQIGFYSLAILGLVLEENRLGSQKILSVPYYFCMVYAASFIATVNLLRGHSVEIWETQRQGPRSHEVEDVVANLTTVNEESS